MTTLPETIVGGTTTGHNANHVALHTRYNRAWTYVECIADGATDNTSIINAAMSAATPGDVLIFPRGAIKTGPITVTKCLHFKGAGRFSTWFIPIAATTSPLITFARTTDSGFGIFANYGPSISDLAIYRNGYMTGPCLSITNATAWMTVKGILCSGGTKSILHRSPNATFEDCFLWDCSDCMIDLTDEGLELHLRHVVMSAQVVNLDTFIRLTMTLGGGLKGALYIDDVTGNTAGGAITVNNGITLVAPAALTGPAYTEIPIFAEKLVIDNINGGGPVLTLTNIATFSMVNSWLNGTNGCVKMDGAIDPHFTNNRYRGGTHTYEFATTRITQGFQSDGCESATSPMYKVGASNKPTDIWANDNLRGFTTIAQVTNDAPWFYGAFRRTWNSLRLQGALRFREAGANPTSGFGTMAAGVLTVSHSSVVANTRVAYWRETTGATGTPGILQHDVADNVAATSFKIKSTSATDTGRVHWVMIGDAD